MPSKQVQQQELWRSLLWARRKVHLCFKICTDLSIATRATIFSRQPGVDCFTNASPFSPSATNVAGVAKWASQNVGARVNLGGYREGCCWEMLWCVKCFVWHSTFLEFFSWRPVAPQNHLFACHSSQCLGSNILLITCFSFRCWLRFEFCKLFLSTNSIYFGSSALKNHFFILLIKTLWPSFHLNCLKCFLETSLRRSSRLLSFNHLSPFKITIIYCYI